MLTLKKTLAKGPNKHELLLIKSRSPITFKIPLGDRMNMPSFNINFNKFLSLAGLGVFSSLFISSPSFAADDLLDIYNLAVAGDPQIRQARALSTITLS